MHQHFDALNGICMSTVGTDPFFWQAWKTQFGTKTWGESMEGKSCRGRGGSKSIRVLGVKERPKVIASRRISSLLRLCPREVMLLFFFHPRGGWNLFIHRQWTPIKWEQPISAWINNSCNCPALWKGTQGMQFSKVWFGFVRPKTGFKYSCQHNFSSFYYSLHLQSNYPVAGNWVMKRWGHSRSGWRITLSWGSIIVELLHTLIPRDLWPGGPGL